MNGKPFEGRVPLTLARQRSPGGGGEVAVRIEYADLVWFVVEKKAEGSSADCRICQLCCTATNGCFRVYWMGSRYIKKKGVIHVSFKIKSHLYMVE